MKAYKLFAVEGSKATSEGLAALKAALAPALVAYENQVVELFQGKTALQHVFTLNSAVMRNTVAHGYGYQTGFLVHVGAA
jgi:hypothetical protein